MNADRLGLYLKGGTAEAGARDPSPPALDCWLELPFQLTFERSSQRWNGGGVAFVHPSKSHRCWFRGWLITREQFEDIFAQENRIAVGSTLPWPSIEMPDALTEVGSSWYRQIINVGATQLDRPAMTFTSPDPSVFTAPDQSYVDTIAAGLAQNPSLDASAIDLYLSNAISVADQPSSRASR